MVASLADLETTGIPGTHQFSEVLIFELLRFQELGIIKNNRDSFELQLNETVTNRPRLWGVPFGAEIPNVAVVVRMHGNRFWMK